MGDNYQFKFRSAEWFYGRDELGFQHRSALRSMGIDVDRYGGRPVIGIANSWSELNNCNMNLREVADAVKRGVIAEGGLPLVADFEGVRSVDPGAAAALRDASRAEFAALADGRLRPELDANGDYVFTADDPDREPPA